MGLNDRNNFNLTSLARLLLLFCCSCLSVPVVVSATGIWRIKEEYVYIYILIQTRD